MSEDLDLAEAQIRSVLHPTDLTAAGDLAFAHALKIALAGKTRLYVLHADAGDGDEIDWSAFPGARATLARWGMLPEGSPTSDVGEKLGIHLAKISTRQHDPVRAIVRAVEEHRNDLVVLATHGRDGMPRWLHGSVAEPVVHKAEVPTLFMAPSARGFVDPDSGALTPLKVLLPIDQRPRPFAALRAAERLCRTLGAADVPLQTLFVGAPGDAPAFGLEEGSPFRHMHATRSGDAVEQILAAATEGECNLIVMATAGHQGLLDALRGSTTERVLRHAPCPVLAVPAI